MGKELIKISLGATEKRLKINIFLDEMKRFLRRCHNGHNGPTSFQNVSKFDGFTYLYFLSGRRSKLSRLAADVETTVYGAFCDLNHRFFANAAI
jgi:hypothetical protein